MADQNRLKWPWSRIIGLLAIICFGLLGCLALAPWAFEVHNPPNDASVTWNGLPVRRYGFSMIHQRAHFNGRDSVGDVIDGRCFIEVEQDGRLRRQYGWKLRRHMSRGPQAQRTRWLEMD